MGTYIIRDVQDFLIERWGQKQMRSDVDLQLAAHAKQVRLENAQLREQNRVLRQALRVAVFVDGPDTVQPEFERWSALVDEGLRQNFNEWYGVQVLVALTATSQPGGTHEL